MLESVSRNSSNWPASSEVLKILASAPSCAVRVYSQAGRLTHWSEGAAQWYGYGRGEALGQDARWLHSVAHEGERFTGVLQDLDSLKQAPEPTHYRLRCADGAVALVHALHLLGRGRSGELELICIDMQVSAAAKSGEGNHGDGELFRAAVAHSPNVVLIKDWEGRFLLANRRLAEFYGTTPEAMLGRDDSSFNPNREQVEGYLANVRGIMRRGRTEVVEETSTKASTGETHHFQSVKVPLLADDGSLRILVIANDVTDLVRERERARIAERRLNHALEATGEGVWDWDIGAGTVDHNLQWCRYLGLDETYLHHPMSVYVERIHPEDLPRVRDALDIALQGDGEYRAEYRMRQSEGGQLWVRDRGRVVARGDDGRALRMVGAIVDITREREAAQRIESLAYYDPLTGLGNRRLLKCRIESVCASVREHGLAALFYLDLDFFKTINDSHGHVVGDQLLIEVGRRLRGAVRESDTVARLGGDEFVVLAGGLSFDFDKARAQAKVLGRKLLGVISRPFEVEGLAGGMTASLGACLISTRDQAADDLLAAADIALYEAKSAGRNRMHFHSEAMRQKAHAQALLELSLRGAIERKELRLVYQPQVAQDGQLLGFEALLRWARPGGEVGPSEFIELAERSGLILPISRWVLRTSARQLARWASDPALCGLSLAVNVSALQFRQADFLASIRSVLAESGAPPERLRLELTESVVLEDIADAESKMFALREIGLSFALDDFGTGYSSLTYLRRLPFDEIKIDRSFIADVDRDEHCASIVRGVLRMCQTLGVRVLAEGVEETAQVDFLVAEGCSAFQGFYFARPLELEAAERFARQARARSQDRAGPGQTSRALQST